jgi:hypothetical protein
LSTAEEAEKLKEPGKFELLATAVLCKAERDYRAILHSGLNAQGQPIKSPVDGFCRVPNSTPPHFVLVEHTVEDNLEKKWLFDHRLVKPAEKGRKKQLSDSDDGDLLKAGRLAQQIKAEFPEARFTVVLTTNQGLKPDFCLKVEKKAEELGVLVDFWDRSRIARFLDTESEGQWLRKEYLGLDAEMLSESLLRDLCYKSLNGYRKQFLTSPEQWVSRQIYQQVENEIDNQSHSIQLLIGNSGSGKSATAYQIGEKHLETGGYSLWLSENVLANSDSLTIALDRALHDLCPSLMLDAGDAALRLLKSRERLLLIADDVNRTSSPVNLLQKLVNWSKPVSSGESDTKSIPSRHLFVCPVWSDIARLVTPDIDKTPWISSVYIGTMTPEEGLEAVQNAFTDAELTSAEAGTLAEKLGNDPILIGLFADLVLSTEPDEPDQVAENVTDNFINRAVEEVSRTGDLLVDEYRSALSNLAAHMLQQRKLNPSLIQLKEWLSNSSNEMKALRQLVKHGKLCRIEKEKLVFRHDRLREALLVKSMGQLLNNATEPLDIFWEPYYAEIIGQAIVRYPQSEAFLKELCDRLPLALVEAIKYIKLSSDSYHQRIIHQIQQWINTDLSLNKVPQSLLDAIAAKLVEVDSSLVLEITKLLCEDRLTLLANLRNGCTMSGIKLCTLQNKRSFAPWINDNLRDQILEHTKHRHGEKISAELRQIMTSTTSTDELRASALTLVGFLELSNFEEEIAICWQLIEEKKIILLMALWAAIKCCSSKSMQILDNLLLYWSELSDIQGETGISQQNWFVDKLSGSFRGKLQTHIIEQLIQQAKKHKVLKIHIMRILDRIDTPDAVEFIVNSMTEIQKEASGKNNIFAYEIRLQDVWGTSSSEQKQLSQTSLEALQSIWKNLGNDACLRYNAFFFWSLCATTKHLSELREIPSNSNLFKQAICKRLELEDFGVIPDLIYILSDDSASSSYYNYWYWLDKIHRVWCPELMDLVDKYIDKVKHEFPKEFTENSINKLSEKQLNTHDYIADLLLRVPEKDAEDLLVKYWDYFKYTFLYVDVALIISTPKCLEIVRDSIIHRPPAAEILNHLGYYSIRSEFSQRINKFYLNRLLPYLKYLEPDELDQIANICVSLNIPGWGREHLIKYMALQSQERFYPSDETLIQQLDKFSQSHDSSIRSHISYWLKNLQRMDVKKDQILNVISTWLDCELTLKRFKIAALCIEIVGSRSDHSLSILDRYKIDSLFNDLSKIKASTQFSIYRRTLD